MIRGFRETLPRAANDIIRNNSIDETANVARVAGAKIVWLPVQVKGKAVLIAVAEVAPNVYVAADGNVTCEAAAVPALADRFADSRRDEQAAHCRRHRFGSLLLITYADDLW